MDALSRSSRLTLAVATLAVSLGTAPATAQDPPDATMKPYPGQVGCYLAADSTADLPFELDPVLHRRGFRLTAGLSPFGRGLAVEPLRPTSRGHVPSASWLPVLADKLVVNFLPGPAAATLVVEGKGRARWGRLTRYHDVGGIPPDVSGPFDLTRIACPK